MTYKIGTRSEAVAIAKILNETDPDNAYRAEPHEFDSAHYTHAGWIEGHHTRMGWDYMTERPVWGVVASGHGFIWNARSLAAWRAEHPIRVIA